jgi:hypothetical protein
LTKKNLRDIIGHVLNSTSVPETAAFLDNMKDMGYKFAFRVRIIILRVILEFQIKTTIDC